LARDSGWTQDADFDALQDLRYVRKTA
jgi:hypothetical protein